MKQPFSQFLDPHPTVPAEILTEIVARLRKVAEPDRIILFGSAARGTLTRDSDIDLIVLEPKVPDPGSEWLKLRDALDGLGYPFDVLVMETARFLETVDTIGGIAYPVSREGRVLYDRS